MALNISTGLRDGILDTNALNTLLAQGEIRIFGGTVPSVADDAESGTLLVTINTVTGSGFNLSFLGAAVSGVLSKAADTWDGVAVSGGPTTATYFRFCASTSDDGLGTVTGVRIQGAISTSGAELNMSSVSITSGATTTIDTFDITMPAS